MRSEKNSKLMLWHQISKNQDNQVGESLIDEQPHRRSPGWILDDPEVQEQVEMKARTLQRRCRYSPSDIKDLEQDLRLFLIQNEGNYDPSRASVGGYVNVLLNSFLKMRIRALVLRLHAGRTPHIHLSDGLSLDSRVDPSSDRDMVEQRDLIAACVDRLSPQEIMSVLLIVEAGQVRACEALEESRRQIRNLLDLVSETCADLDAFSE